MPPINKIWLWLGMAVGSLIGLILVIYLASFLFASGVNKTINKQLDAIKAEDAVLAYSYTTKSFQEITSLENFTKFINAYSGLRNNKSITIKERKTKDDVVFVKATLISRGGSQTPIRYQLIKENGQWKIQGMIINPDEDKQNKTSADAGKETTTAAPPTPTPPSEVEKTQPAALNNYYQDPRYGYSVRYPADWQYAVPHKGVVVFRGQNNASSYNSTITLQTLVNNRRRSVDQVVNDTRALIAQQSSQMRVIDSGTIPSLQAGSAGLQARYTVYSYTINNQDYGLLDVIYYKNPNRALYVFDYATTAAQFEADIPVAKGMVNSFYGK